MQSLTISSRNVPSHSGVKSRRNWQIVLNESMLHKVHPIPEVHETLALLAETMVFSELDANCGFWQIALAKESGC